jgi:hypothetical protein
MGPSVDGRAGVGGDRLLHAVVPGCALGPTERLDCCCLGRAAGGLCAQRGRVGGRCEALVRGLSQARVRAGGGERADCGGCTVGAGRRCAALVRG